MPRGKQFWPFLPPCHCLAPKWGLAWHGGRAEQYMGAGKQRGGGLPPPLSLDDLIGWVCNWMGHYGRQESGLVGSLADPLIHRSCSLEVKGKRSNAWYFTCSRTLILIANPPCSLFTMVKTVSTGFFPTVNSTTVVREHDQGSGDRLWHFP